MSNALALVVPVRAFEQGKSRLADELTSDQRIRLARAMAEVVVAPRDHVDTIVVCNDDSVAHWARGRGVAVALTDAKGLNPSLAATRDAVLDSTDAQWIVIAHADLPRATDVADVVRGAIDSVFDLDTVVLAATDRRHDGTNVLVLPRALFAVWNFAYGPQSYPAHVAEAHRLGARMVEVDDPSLMVDIDTRDDLDAVRDFVADVLPDWKPR